MAIQYKLKLLIAQKELDEARKLSYKTIYKESGISTNTITQMINQRQDLIGKTTINKMCRYFDCQPGDIMKYIPDPESDSTNTNM